ncbi:MAG: ribonuclease HII [Nanoarchaeota archaeon]|nr:ribonuclease HII [Nanoarchaeota archaeon]MBU1030661.1 ribonuclease HII [Nanoarchaeota archaeon]MBU1850312.1 ribonuclease HII [Nanoarchaeota archaeon]
MLIGGIDEAGRGPVIGPLVMAIAVIKEEDEFKLKALGVKDSKLLSPKKREEMISVLKEICQTVVLKISPSDVDKAVLSSSDNLNWLEARTAAKLISAVTCKKVILDCPSTNLESYKEYIKNKLNNKLTNKDVKIIVEHKADLNHLIVGAASILAKVARDEEIKKIQKEIGVDFGSGYSSDPKTQVFIENNWSNPKYEKYIRKSWDTYKKRESNAAQKSLGEF